MMSHAGDVAVAEDYRYEKLILICLSPAVEDVVAEYVVHIVGLYL